MKPILGVNSSRPSGIEDSTACRGAAFLQLDLLLGDDRWPWFRVFAGGALITHREPSVAKGDRDRASNGRFCFRRIEKIAFGVQMDFGSSRTGREHPLTP